MLDRDHSGTVFDKMKPVNKPPSMHTVNGLGTTVYGRRAFDRETQTYVKTHVVCILFIPVLALGSYRVKDCETGGWYFLGKVPLSGLAKAYNYLVLAAFLGLSATVWWEAHTSSPEYIAEKEFAHALELQQQGKIQDAAKAYIKMVNEQSYNKEKAINALKPLCKNLMDKAVTSAEIQAATGIIHKVNRVHKNTYPNLDETLKNKAMEFGAKKDHVSALEVLKLYLPLKPDDEKMTAMKVYLLRQILEKDIANHKVAIELADSLDKEGKFDEAVKVLKGRDKYIVNTSAAAILGKFYYKNGDLPKALELLQPYIETQIKEMSDLEVRYNNLYSSEYNNTADTIARGMNVVGRDFTKDEIAKIQKSTEMLLAKNDNLERVRQALIKKTEIVPVALDLGAARLSRAQSMPPGDLRKNELMEVEKQFLAIRNFAGNSDDYKYFLGQVYYWLGKDKEAALVFSELEKNNAQNGNVLLSMCRVLREVGEVDEARRISEKLFNTANDKLMKNEAALFRALVYKDKDDEIEWLKKCPEQNDSVLVHLNDALGRKAQDDGQEAEAEKYFRKVIDAYSKMTKNSSVYNNMGLVYQRLYQISNKIEDFQKGANMLNQAVQMEPDNSILLNNTSDSLGRLALLNALEGKSDPKLYLYGLSEISSFMYDNQWEKKAFEKNYKGRDYQKSLELRDKAVLLSPKNISLLINTISYHGDDENITKLTELENRLKTMQIDLEPLIKNYKEAYSPESLKEDLELTAKALEKRKAWLAKPEVQKDKLAKAVAEVNMLNSMLSLYYNYGQKVDLQAIEKAAEELTKAKPCHGTRDLLDDVLVYELIEELANKDPEFRTLQGKCRNSIRPWSALLYYLTKKPAKAALLKGSQFLEKVIASKKRYNSNYSTESLQDWAFFNIFEKDYASKIKAHILSKKYIEMIHSMNLKTTPYSPGVVLMKYWLETMKGNKQQAEAALAEGLKYGISMGYDQI